jgi:hypothetical protein
LILNNCFLYGYAVSATPVIAVVSLSIDPEHGFVALPLCWRWLRDDDRMIAGVFRHRVAHPVPPQFIACAISESVRRDIFPRLTSPRFGR